MQPRRSDDKMIAGLQRRGPALLLAAVTIVLALMLCGIRAAEAHAVLEQSAPGDRSIQAMAPSSFTLQFDEPVGVTDLRLLDAAGKAIKLNIQASNNIVQAAIAEPLADGTYTITYRIISADGHPVAGAVQFQVGGGMAHWQAQTERLAWWQWGKIVTRLLLYLSGFAFWGLAYRSVRHGSDAPRLAVIASFTVILAACLSIGFQGAGMTGLAPVQFLGSDIWIHGGATPEGRIGVMFMAALAIGWLAQSLRMQRHLSFILMGICAALLISALSTAGHVAALGWLQMSVLTIHVLFALLWGASLVPLLKRLGRGRIGPVAASPRRRWPWLVMAGAIGSGIGLACWQIVEPGMLLASAYGLTLSSKIAAVMLLVIAIFINRRISARAAVPGSGSTLRGWVLAQISLLVLILGLTATLGELTPPRHLLAAARDRAGAAMQAITKTVHAGNAMASIRLEPLGSGQPGKEQYRLTASLMSMADGAQLTPQQVSVALTNLDAHIGPLSREMTNDKAAGAYVTQPLDLVPAGRWRFDIQADLDDFDRRHFILDAVIAP
jgi:copper transport protein